MFVAQPCDQQSQACPVSFRHRRELEPHSVGGFYVADDGVSPDLSLVDEKLNLGCCLDGRWCGCRDKQTTGAEVLH